VLPADSNRLLSPEESQLIMRSTTPLSRTLEETRGGGPVWAPLRGSPLHAEFEDVGAERPSCNECHSAPLEVGQRSPHA
jgi:hypothetical protein